MISAGAAATSAWAGCLSSPTNDTDESGNPSGAAAFFTLQDWGNHVAGEALSFDTPVEVGEMGHGWDPPPTITSDVAANDVFLYLDTPEFQWAIDVAGELATEEMSTVAIDGMQAVDHGDLLPFVDDDEDLLPDPDTDVSYDPDELQVGAFDVVYANDVTAWWHDDHWHGGLPDIPVENDRRLFFTVEDTDGNVLPLGSEHQFSIRAELTDAAPTDVIDIDNRGDSVTLAGAEPGTTLVVFILEADGTPIFDTANDPLTVTVAEPEEVEVDAFHDPHIWVDPVHAQSVVDLFAAELGAVFPDHADTFEENAGDYKEELTRIDDAFEQLVADAELDVAVLVAHDAFQYLEQRYGFELQTPVGVTPDAVEGIEDVASLAETIETYEIETILYDPFEAPDPDNDIPRAAQVLIEDTETAENAAPLTPVEATTPRWRDEGYGWIEQMESINLPSLRAALKAE